MPSFHQWISLTIKVNGFSIWNHHIPCMCAWTRFFFNDDVEKSRILRISSPNTYNWGCSKHLSLEQYSWFILNEPWHTNLEAPDSDVHLALNNDPHVLYRNQCFYPPQWQALWIWIHVLFFFLLVACLIEHFSTMSPCHTWWYMALLNHKQLTYAYTKPHNMIMLKQVHIKWG